ncbi:MAG: hypothetical protein ACJATT_006032 [Myxococcota bacterium]
MLKPPFNADELDALREKLAQAEQRYVLLPDSVHPQMS